MGFSVNNVTWTVTCQLKKGEEGQTEMLKQSEIKVSPCKKYGIHQPIDQEKMASVKKSIKFAKSNLLSVLEAEVKLSNIVGQHDISLPPSYVRTKILWVKSNIVELTWSTSSTPALDLIVFIQKSHVLENKRLDIS